MFSSCGALLAPSAVKNKSGALGPYVGSSQAQTF